MQDYWTDRWSSEEKDFPVGVSPLRFYDADEADAEIENLKEVMLDALKFMNEGAYGLAAVTLTSVLNPPTSEL